MMTSPYADKLEPGKGKITDLDSAVGEHLADVDVLRAGKRFAAAISHGIYALEIQLKVAICRRLDLDELPVAFQSHSLQGLLYISGLKKRLDLAEFALVKNRWNQLTMNRLAYDLNLLRYHPSSITEADANQFFNILLDKISGVLTWVVFMTLPPGGASHTP